MMSSKPMDLVRILAECPDSLDRICGRCCVGLALPSGFLSGRNGMSTKNASIFFEIKFIG